MAARKLPQRKSHRLPAEVYASPYHEYFFTICARHQGTPFNEPRLAKAVIESLLWTKKEYGWVLFCYCLMPDHLHFLCRPTRESVPLVNGGSRGEVPEGVLEHVARFKSFTTNNAWKLGRTGLLWQRSSYDRVFDMERPFQQVARYVLDNPVRRGLAESWEKWPYSAIVDPWEVDE